MDENKSFPEYINNDNSTQETSLGQIVSNDDTDSTNAKTSRSNKVEKIIEYSVFICAAVIIIVMIAIKSTNSTPTINKTYTSQKATTVTAASKSPSADQKPNPDDIILNSNTSKSGWDLGDDDYRLSWSEYYRFLWRISGYSAFDITVEEITNNISDYFIKNPDATLEQATKSVGDGYGFIDKENKWYANVKLNKPEPKDEQLDKSDAYDRLEKWYSDNFENDKIDEQYGDNLTNDISYDFRNSLEYNGIIAELDNYDVQYDRYGSLDKVFAFSGTAELDDYYNYGWYDDEQYYFCIFVTPHGGSYSDSWYIYCDRNSFPNFFEDLKAYGIIDVELACYIPSYKYESNQGNMANLRAVQY